MPIFAKLPALTAEAAQKRVYQRVQSLYVYACAVLVFGVVIVFGHQQVFGDALPIGLQIVSYTAAVLAVPCAAVLLASKRPDTVKRVLYVLWAGYTAAICTGFWMIIQNFVYFFGGIGLLIVIQMGFWLWTRSVLRDVNELSPTN